MGEARSRRRHAALVRVVASSRFSESVPRCRSASAREAPGRSRGPRRASGTDRESCRRTSPETSATSRMRARRSSACTSARRSRSGASRSRRRPPRSRRRRRRRSRSPAQAQLRGPRPRHLGRRLAAGHRRRRRAEPLRPGRQHVDRHLQQDGGATRGVHVRHALVGAGNGTPCDTDNSGDPTVIYDPMADRYIVADFAFSRTSRTGRTTSASRSRRRAIRSPAAGGSTPFRADDAAHPWFPDYPKMGIWPDGLYMTANMFDCDLSTFPGSPRLGVQPLRSGVRRDLALVVVDLNTATVLQPAAEQPARRRCRRRDARTCSSASRRPLSPSRSSSSTSTTAAAARPSPARRTSARRRYTVATCHRAEPGEPRSTRCASG